MNLIDSKTKENLMRSFAGESMARSRYTIAAAAAKKEGCPVLELIFRYTADQERAHAGIFYDYLRQCGCTSVDISAGFPVGERTDLPALLQEAVHNEEEEHGVVYPDFARLARNEGFPEIAQKFDMIAGIEQTHAQRFQKFLDFLSQNRLFVSERETGWICLNCGYVTRAAAAPKACPVCAHPQGWFCRLELSPWQS